MNYLMTIMCIMKQVGKEAAMLHAGASVHTSGGR